MKRESFSRFWLVGFVFALFGLVMFLWVIRLQTFPQADILKQDENIYRHTTRTVYPERGNIYDRMGHLLAGNVQVFEVGADTSRVANPETVATTLASVLGADYNEMMRLLLSGKPNSTDRNYVVLARYVATARVDELQKISDQFDTENAKQKSSLFGGKQKANPSLAGLEFAPMLMRSYPENTLAANILGFYSYQQGPDAKGNYGIEGKYDDLLGGKPVTYVVDNDPQQAKNPPDIPAGASLVLTIDRDIQTMTESVLDEAIKKNEATGGTIIIMDPKTGEILSMAVQPRMNLNEYWKMSDVYPAGTSFNRAVGTTYEPGSVFKVLTMAAALDAGAVKPDTQFLDTGTYMIGGVAIHNWDRGAYGPQNMIGCMQHSLNVCLSWVADQLGPTRFYKYLNNFGIGHKTGVDLAGESNYPLHVPGDPEWYMVNLGTNSFGQGVAVTPIQLITAVDAVANHGKMMAPRLLHSIIQDGEERPYPPQLIGRPISAQAADTLTDMLAQSIEKEALDNVKVPGYRFAGKTGTAEIPGPDGYTSNVTNASFVGWGPVDDPRFLVFVWLEKPKTSIWGSVVAAPVFSEIVNKLVVLMDIPPDNVRKGIAQKP